MARQDEEETPKCPVDASSRGWWFGKQKVQEEAQAPAQTLQQDQSAASACPVDHTARQEWLDKVKNSAGTTITNAPVAVEEPETCSSDKLNSSPQSGINITSNVSLPDERQISSIPRTGADSNWIYPSQKQFFDAMKRKNWNPHAKDMKSVVPIHNAVNERAWMLIQLWERGYGAEECGGVQLTSFKGDSKKLTPRARWKLFMGYEKPFDRHDWTINRCGKEVDYVIDFYSGRPTPNSAVPSFYLDVRPKLNSFEGFKMRFLRAMGFE